MSLSNRTQISVSANVEIDLVEQNDYTHFVEIAQLTSGTRQIMQMLPIDPTDHTILGAISSETLRLFGEDAQPMLKALSISLPALGAKEIMVIPADTTLIDFTLANEYKKCDRLRYSNRETLNTIIENNLSECKDFTAELDKRFHFIASADELMQGRDLKERYQEITGILSQARFTDGKQNEYKEEDLQGKVSRIKNNYIRPITMLDEKGNIAGMIRAVIMGNGFVYLSDEVVNQTILPLDKFNGASEDEQKATRELFLLNYLIHNAAKHLADQKNLLIIAAAGREALYEKVGFGKCPSKIDNYQVVMNFDKPGPLLTAIKERIAKLPLSSFAKTTNVSQHYATQFTRRPSQEDNVDQQKITNTLKLS